MKKVQELKSRIKKKLLRSDGEGEPTRPSSSTPVPANNPATVSPPVEQAPSHLPQNAAGAPIPISIPVPKADQEQPIAPAAGQTESHLSLAPAGLVPTCPSTPNPDPQQLGTPAVEQVASLTCPEPIQVQDPTEPSPATPKPDYVTPTAVEQIPVDTPAPNKGSASFRSESWSWIKSEGWANLRGFLDNTAQVASVSGLGPIKEVAEAVAKHVRIFEEAAQGRKDFDKLRKELDGIFGELNEYCSLSPAITMSMESICGSIRKEMKDLETQQARSTSERVAKAETDADYVLECYGRVQGHLQRLSRNANMSTWKIVDELATESRLQKLAPLLSECYNSKKTAELGRRPCTMGTRIKVLAQMNQWATGRDTGNIYWMSGMAGTGKTTIAYTFCELLDAEPNRALFASFFCSRSLPECRDVGLIIPSIAYQLARSSQPFRYALSRATEKNPDAHTRSPELQFDALITKPLSNKEVRDALPVNMVVVIDALDECEDTRSTERILDVLLTKSKGLPMRFVISTRPEATIRDLMEKDGYDSRVVLHDLDSREVKTDIKAYLEAELAPINPSVVEIEKLVERAGVLFIYAATVIRYVGHDNFKRKSRQRLNMMLSTSKQQGGAQTKAIDELYGAILEAAVNDDQLDETDRDDMKLILNTVICAKAPLTIDALNGLLKLGDVERVDSALRPLWSVLHVIEPSKTVTTLHASFPDYLTDSKRSSSEWHCDPAAHNRVLAERCFEYIQGTKPQFNICRLPSSFLYDDEVNDIEARVNEFIPAEFRYACQYWAAHLVASDPAAASALMALLNYFLTRNLLTWMEVMNLTKNMPAGPDHLSIVKRWAVPHSPTRELIDLLHDAMRFTNTIISSPVLQSTPHIYITMLPFLPLHSQIRKHYAGRTRELIGVHGTALDRRKGLLAQWTVWGGNCAAYSADGTLLATGPSTSMGPISLINISSGQSLRTIYHQDVYVARCISFSPDGTRIACGTFNNESSVDEAIWVWDISNGQPLLGPLVGHRAPIISIVFSQDGSRFISGSGDKTIRIWDARSGECVLGPLVGHTKSVRCLAVSSDDTMLVSGSDDSTIRVWDMQSGIPLFNPIAGHTNAVKSVALSPDDSWIVSASEDCTVRVWDIRTGEMLLSPLKHEDQRPTSVAISPDGAFIAAGFKEGAIHTWDTTTGKVVSNLPKEHSNDTRLLKYSNDGTRMISYSYRWLRVFDVQSTAIKLDALPGHTESILSIDVSPDGKRIVSGSEDTTLCIWDPIAGSLIHGPLAGHDWSVHLVKYSSDGSRFLSCSRDRTLRQWDAKTGSIYEVDSPMLDPFIPPRYSSETGFVSATYSPDSNSIAAISLGGDIYIWDSNSGEMTLEPIKAEKEGRVIEFSADSKTVITGWRNGAAHIWDVQTGQLVSSNQPPDGLDVAAFAFSPSHQSYIITSNQYEDNPMLYQSGPWTQDHTTSTLEGHKRYIRTVRYSSDGTQIASGSEDKTMHIWSVHTGLSVFGPLRGHTETINSVAYSPDGTFVVSASSDKTIRIWDTRPNQTDSQVLKSPGVSDWVLNEDGWVIDEQSRRLLWVPTDLRTSLMSPRNTVLLSRDGYVKLNFEGSLIGEDWDGCWMDSKPLVSGHN
ncbi:hypothetical protein B0J17DRAFT_620985 [Rhizoctonia solani]|nr:hypothetical protein B0J17DRAFT_620985 [Rhizoctonia solani]